MSLNVNAVGIKAGPLELKYNWRKLALYALSIGASTQGELEYVYEKNMKMFPIYWGSILSFTEYMNAYEIGNLEPFMQLGFDMTFHKYPQRMNGTMTYTVELKNIYDRGPDKGCVADIEAVGFDEDGDKLFTLKDKEIYPNNGGFGGPKSPRKSVDYPDREPDLVVEDYIGVNQMALYRIGNHGVLPMEADFHIDPELAHEAGFDKPIIAHMCTAGFAFRAFIKSVCPGSPEKVKAFGCSFNNPLEPGTTIQTQIWKMDDHSFIWRLLDTNTGKYALNYGTAEI